MQEGHISPWIHVTGDPTAVFFVLLCYTSEGTVEHMRININAIDTEMLGYYIIHIKRRQ